MILFSMLNGVTKCLLKLLISVNYMRYSDTNGPVKHSETKVFQFPRTCALEIHVINVVYVCFWSLYHMTKDHIKTVTNAYLPKERQYLFKYT